ncbi:zinc-binding alcohol dehydrogenase/oxidoreductase [Gracilibacillus halotolerans]|uniref:Zinc-binding alcohol dehydrogenase/oxidoreductase n=1 Tax=Gracilibacillus halotolerans TaxID=74386 RepID=A0A841RJY6_9BACI|nr:zinc-binding dehydrogenase [Gracilibacillus halotolerans]MBB6511284.1 zinc-binding alcohol dehydrogenase/oxidoreductase [Gracilibacillus halotolerans]
MKAYVLKDEAYQFDNVMNKTVGKNELVVQLKTAGLNHRDLKLVERVPSTGKKFILGSDGAGIVKEVGEGVEDFQVGDEVMINPGLNWYNQSEAPPNEFEIVGVPFNGTFAEEIVMPADFVAKKPAYLSWEEAGVLSLSALTGFRALFTQGEIQPGETLFIPGVGSGVNSFIIKMAKAIGARVITTSRSEEKLTEAQTLLGFDRGILTNSEWSEELQNETIDLVIESVGGLTFNRSLSVLRKGGTMVMFGSSTEDETTINLREFFYGQYTLKGSTMGSREEYLALLQFMEKHQIKPLMDKVYSFEELDEAFDYLKEQKQLGKIAIQIQK